MVGSIVDMHNLRGAVTRKWVDGMLRAVETVVGQQDLAQLTDASTVEHPE